MPTLTELIKELREKTGAGFLDCKKSLEENNNDIDKSIEALRKKGLAKASKKSDRAAIEGAVGFYSNKDIIILDEATSALDINTENSILNLIKSIKLNKTIILVSHRKNVLEFADKVLMLDDGKVIK